ncbi:MAG: hypothetical protein KJ052_20735 [Candidatus Hydrogenedentes bacterium]|nr:hypothetical protein [Candidatus Hydrogenedentota bacterium]
MLRQTRLRLAALGIAAPPSNMPAGAWMGVDDFIMERLLAVFSFSLFYLLIFSNLLTVFSTLYRSHEVNSLLLAPVFTESFFLARFFSCGWA